MVLWNPNFTSEEPQYELSFVPGETKTSMVKNYLGLILPEESNQETILKLQNDFGTETYVAEWETFLTAAEPDQIEYVQITVCLMQELEICVPGFEHPDKIKSHWDSQTLDLKKEILQKLNVSPM